MLILRSRSRLLDTQMCPQPRFEHRNIVPHERTSSYAQLIKIRAFATAPPVPERMYGDAESGRYRFLVDKFGNVHLRFWARTSVNSRQMTRSNAFIGHLGKGEEDGEYSEIKS